jgi:antitoxin ParD1/3/4
MSIPINLTPQQEQFIQEQVERGKFNSAEEVINQALKLLEEEQMAYEAWVEEVRGKVDEAAAELARGEGIPLDTVFSGEN